ncbi:TetR family transcriptional regulator [Microbacterium sp. W1N]|uniref:TetR/AcrR family transcriptional regulator n=1 Tax=Microbacterium festucae TaxID=2977531 RepID=UPI0021BE3E77|nr:TetR family transcriptional regulator [Microbacterium festucae]MCT9819441.1 TetR family transcriptional regulator [Microbacterium festucae]
MTSARRYDPGRRDRIIDACLEVIAEVGVAGASHRRIAERADVPLGSMTYHFRGIDELLREAFERFTDSMSARFAARLAGDLDHDAAIRAVADLIEQDVFVTRRDLVLTHELYTLAARDEAFRAVTNRWMRRSRDTLSAHFDPATALMIDALIEGLTIHAALDTEPRDPAITSEAVRRLASKSEPD